MNGLDLFSGIGGISLALEPWVRTVCYVEFDGYCQRVLQARIRNGLLDDAPIWDDIRTFDGRPWAGVVDIVFGGFPCQDVSVAGKREGLKDGNRSGLWAEMHRLVCEIRPRFVFVENVPGLLSAGFGRVLGELAASGYDAEWLCLQAAEVGAPHRRERIFVLAYTTGIRRDLWRPEGQGIQRTNTPCDEAGECGLADVSYANQGGCRCPEDEQGQEPARRGGPTEGGENMADALGTGLQGRNVLPERISQRVVGTGGMADAPSPRGAGLPQREAVSYAELGSFSPGYWREDPADDPESRLGRVAHGVPHQVDRLRCLGNAVVPLQARMAFEMLIERMAKGREG